MNWGIAFATITTSGRQTITAANCARARLRIVAEHQGEKLTTARRRILRRFRSMVVPHGDMSIRRKEILTPKTQRSISTFRMSKRIVPARMPRSKLILRRTRNTFLSTSTLSKSYRNARKAKETIWLEGSAPHNWRNIALHSVESHCITRLESVGLLEAHFHPYGWVAGP